MGRTDWRRDFSLSPRYTGLFDCVWRHGGGPFPSAPLRVTIQPNPTFAPSPGMATFSARVENVGMTTTALTFPSSCQVLPYFLDARTGQPVIPRGGGFACLTVITHVSLGPGESLPQSFPVRSGDVPEPGSIVLPPRDYQVRARLRIRPIGFRRSRSRSA